MSPTLHPGTCHQPQDSPGVQLPSGGSATLGMLHRKHARFTHLNYSETSFRQRSLLNSSDTKLEEQGPSEVNKTSLGTDSTGLKIKQDTLAISHLDVTVTAALGKAEANNHLRCPQQTCRGHTSVLGLCPGAAVSE